MARKPKTKGKKKGGLKALVKKEVNLFNKKNVEQKEYSEAFGPTPVFVGTLGRYRTQITDISQSILDNGRSGDEVTIKWARIKCGFYNNYGAGSNPYTVFRLVVFQYNSSDNAPDIDKMLLVANGNGTAATYGPWSMRNIDYMNTYTILLDKTVTTVNHQAAGLMNSNSYQVKQWKVPLKFCKKKIQFHAGGNTAENALWLFCMTAQDSVVANPMFNYSFAVGYTDS